MRVILLTIGLFIAPHALADLGGSAIRERVVAECPLAPSGFQERCKSGKTRGLCEVRFFDKPAFDALAEKPPRCEGARDKLAKLGFTAPDLAQLNPAGAEGVYCGFCRLPATSRPQVELSTPVVKGGRSVVEILTVLKAYRNQVRHCYEQALQRLPAFQGQADLSFGLEGDGKPRNVAVKLDPPEEALVRCLEGKAARWPFPQDAAAERAKPAEVSVRIDLKLVKD